MIGKKVLNNVYWHSSLTNVQNDEVQQHIAEAETLACLQAGTDYNVVKYDINANLVAACNAVIVFPALMASAKYR